MDHRWINDLRYLKSSRHNIFLSLSFFLILSLSSCNQADKNNSAQDLPNIIFILAEDLGYGDLACYGHPYAQTPNLDALAAEGIRFDRFYAAGMTCSPCRTALMTGKYPANFKNSVEENGFGGNVSLTELLKEAGYNTAHIGKWHIGPNTQIDKNPYGIDFIGTMGENRDTIRGRDTDIFNQAIDFITHNHGKGPFYINIWTHICHLPIDPTEQMLGHFEGLEIDEEKFGRWFREEKLEVLKERGRDINDAMKMYLAELYTLDLNIGRLLQCLKEQNLEQNTMIIFSSDHGPAPVYVDKNIDPKKTEKRLNMLGYAGGLRGGKHSQYEGGVRVPFIVKWPEKIPMNQTDNESVISGLDYLPTICSIVGLDMSGYSFDGMDKSKVWLGEPEIRQGPLYWKRSARKAAISVLDGPWKMHLSKNGDIELYNLDTDPFEENDISEENENIANSIIQKADIWNSSFQH